MAASISAGWLGLSCVASQKALCLARENPIFIYRTKFRVCKTIAYAIDPVGCKKDDDHVNFIEEHFGRVMRSVKARDFQGAAAHYKILSDGLREHCNEEQVAFYQKGYETLLRRAQRSTQ